MILRECLRGLIIAALVFSNVKVFSNKDQKNITLFLIILSLFEIFLFILFLVSSKENLKNFSSLLIFFATPEMNLFV